VGKTTPVQVMANEGKKMKIGDREFLIKSPSLGVASLMSRELKELFVLAEFDFDKLDKEKTTAEELVQYVFKKIYDLLFSEKADQAVDIISRILALLINNRPLDHKDCVITPDEIKWELEITELFPVMLEIIKLGDLTDFFMMILRLVQMHDVEQNLKPQKDKENDVKE
jgi:hypothetical protein